MISLHTTMSLFPSRSKYSQYLQCEGHYTILLVTLLCTTTSVSLQVKTLVIHRRGRLLSLCTIMPKYPSRRKHWQYIQWEDHLLMPTVTSLCTTMSGWESQFTIVLVTLLCIRFSCKVKTLAVPVMRGSLYWCTSDIALNHKTTLLQGQNTGSTCNGKVIILIFW